MSRTGPGWSSPWNHGISRKGARIELALEPQHLKKREPDAASCSGTKEFQEKGPGWSAPWIHEAIVKDSIWIWLEFSFQQTLPLKRDHLL